MLNFFKTIRARLLFSFVTFLLLTGGFMLATDYWFESQERSVQRILSILERIELNIQTTQRLEFIFLNDEVINENFYETGLSDILNKKHEKVNQIREDFTKLEQIKSIQSTQVQEDIEIFKQKFAEYEHKFSQLIELIKQRGFKAYGYEGKMRNSIHSLENSNLNMVKILTIRRHEKDFILRKQKDYLQKWSEAVNDLRQDIAGQIQILNLLNQYTENFQKLANAEEKIGFSDKDGLKKQLAEISQIIESKTLHINDLVRQEVSSLKRQNELIRLIAFGLGLALFIWVAFYITQLLSNPISLLSEAIHQVVESDFLANPELLISKSEDEISQLSNDVAYLVKTVQTSITEIKEKSGKIAQKQEILMNGVNYAKRIQKAILPNYELQENFKNHFVLFRPQYDVSGDFYWFTQLNDKCYIAVVDCTGRGIAGAFMSLIGNSLLNKIVKENKLEDLSLILETLNLEFRIALGQDKQRSDDSMEICLCRVEPSQEKENYRKITFTGAMRPLIYSSGWEIHEIKGTLRPIGGNVTIGQANFETHTFELKKGNFLYLSTNGFANQQDKSRQPYGNTQFKEYLRKIIHLPLPEQVNKLNEEMDDFLEGTPQRDDITVLGIKL